MFAALFGIPQSLLPPTWEKFTTYNEAIWASDTLTVIPQAQAIAEQVLGGGQLGFRAPEWYLAVPAELLPPRLRRDLGLPYGAAEQRLAAGALRWIQGLYPALPGPLRYVGPYKEALGRLSGRARWAGERLWAEYEIHVAGLNLGALVRARFGRGTPKPAAEVTTEPTSHGPFSSSLSSTTNPR